MTGAAAADRAGAAGIGPQVALWLAANGPTAPAAGLRA
eukprot:gene3720-6210_t